MPNARCILPSRRRRRDIPRDGACPAASGGQVMTSPIIKTWPEFVNALCSTCCFWPIRPPLRMTADLRRARSIPWSSLLHALSRPSTWARSHRLDHVKPVVQPCPIASDARPSQSRTRGLEHCDDRRCRCELELRYDGNAVKRSALRDGGGLYRGRSRLVG